MMYSGKLIDGSQKSHTLNIYLRTSLFQSKSIHNNSEICKTYRSPLCCLNCSAYLSLYTQLDENEWECPFCKSKNPPFDLGNVLADSYPELNHNEVIFHESLIQTSSTSNSIFVLAFDYCISLEQELECLLNNTISNLPKYSKVAILSISNCISILRLNSIKSDTHIQMDTLPGDSNRSSLFDHLFQQDRYTTSSNNALNNISAILAGLKCLSYHPEGFKINGKYRRPLPIAAINPIFDISECLTKHKDSSSHILLFCTRSLSILKPSSVLNNPSHEGNYNIAALCTTIGQEYSKKGCYLDIIYVGLDVPRFDRLSLLASATGGTVITDQSFTSPTLLKSIQFILKQITSDDPKYDIDQYYTSPKQKVLVQIITSKNISITGMVGSMMNEVDLSSPSPSNIGNLHHIAHTLECSKRLSNINEMSGKSMKSSIPNDILSPIFPRDLSPIRSNSIPTSSSKRLISSESLVGLTSSSIMSALSRKDEKVQTVYNRLLRRVTHHSILMECDRIQVICELSVSLQYQTIRNGLFFPSSASKKSLNSNHASSTNLDQTSIGDEVSYDAPRPPEFGYVQLIERYLDDKGENITTYIKTSKLPIYLTSSVKLSYETFVASLDWKSHVVGISKELVKDYHDAVIRVYGGAKSNVTMFESRGLEDPSNQAREDLRDKWLNRIDTLVESFMEAYMSCDRNIYENVSDGDEADFNFIKKNWDLAAHNNLLFMFRALYHLREGPLLDGPSSQSQLAFLMRHQFINSPFNQSIAMLLPTVSHYKIPDFKDILYKYTSLDIKCDNTLSPESMSLFPNVGILVDLGDILIIRPPIAVPAVISDISDDGSTLDFESNSVTIKSRSANTEILMKHIESEADKLCQGRFPIPIIYNLSASRSPQYRLLYSRLSPSHMDSQESQIMAVPQLTMLSSDEMEYLITTAPMTDQPSFEKYLWMAIPRYARVRRQYYDTVTSNSPVKGEQMKRRNDRIWLERHKPNMARSGSGDSVVQRITSTILRSFSASTLTDRSAVGYHRSEDYL